LQDLPLACCSSKHAFSSEQPMKPGDAMYSPEFELVLACLRWPEEAADGDRIRSLAQKPLRWSHLLEIAHRHKVVPLFSRNLNAFTAG
jgi:hypothetical protein